jgi:hypothetical protein
MLQPARVARVGGWVCLGLGGLFLVLAVTQAAAHYVNRRLTFLPAPPSSYAIYIKWLPPAPSELMQVAVVFAIFAIALFLASQAADRRGPVGGS